MKSDTLLCLKKQERKHITLQRPVRVWETPYGRPEAVLAMMAKNLRRPDPLEARILYIENCFGICYNAGRQKTK